jgi:hypothetical protein
VNPCYFCFSFLSIILITKQYFVDQSLFVDYQFRLFYALVL